MLLDRPSLWKKYSFPSGAAMKPGDIIRSHSGKTIEIINTDAEGRLILADALAYAARFDPAAVVDCATLTGGVVIALGSHASAVLGNDPALVAEVIAAGENSGERCWQLPLWEEYERQLDSEVADRVVDPAEPPRAPVRPRKLLNMVLAIFGGAIFALGLTFFFEYLDNRIKSPDEIRSHLGLAPIGLIPALGKKWAASEPVISNGVPANFAEAFRTLRTNVLFSSAEEGVRIIVVTSAGPGEGKSLFSSNLAVSLAQAGQRVLHVDAGFHVMGHGV